MTERIKKELLARLDKRLNEVVDGDWGGAGDLLLDVAAARIAELEVKEKLLKRAADRHLPCPDHRDKFNTSEDGCPYCRIEEYRIWIETILTALEEHGMDKVDVDRLRAELPKEEPTP